MKEAKIVREQLRDWRRIREEDGILCRIVQVGDNEVKQLIPASQFFKRLSR